MQIHTWWHPAEGRCSVDILQERYVGLEAWSLKPVGKCSVDPAVLFLQGMNLALPVLTCCAGTAPSKTAQYLIKTIFRKISYIISNIICCMMESIDLSPWLPCSIYWLGPGVSQITMQWHWGISNPLDFNKSLMIFDIFLKASLLPEAWDYELILFFIKKLICKNRKIGLMHIMKTI